MSKLAKIKKHNLPQAIQNGFNGLTVKEEAIVNDVNWLIKEVETLREQNLELVVANENAEKEIIVLENRIRNRSDISGV